IFMSVQEEQDDWEKPYAYIMYIDIGPITRYIVTLNWAFFAVLLAISSVMCLLGFRFGRDIEKEAERQQTFFQNASHELKTPLMAIQGYAEGIQAGVMDTGSAAEVILKESDRMTELVDELWTSRKSIWGGSRLPFPRWMFGSCSTTACAPWSR
ncbi:MAG: histidine kinase dimerization/phospho-acceptor domain-containing protein, partial [Dysosmobacter sp.]